MRKFILSVFALVLAAATLQAQVAEPIRNTAERPAFSPVKVQQAASVAMPKRVRAHAAGALQAAFSVQGAASQGYFGFAVGFVVQHSGRQCGASACATSHCFAGTTFPYAHPQMCAVYHFDKFHIGSLRE